MAYLDSVLQNLYLAKNLGELSNEVDEASDLLLETIRNNGKIFIAGNAGAGSNGEHFVSELVGRFYKNRRALPAISLNSDNTTITCISNDFGYQYIFSRQLEALFNPEKDIFISMSSSGNSVNINVALEYLTVVNGKAVNLIGADGGTTLKLYGNNKDFLNIVIPSHSTPRIQEAQMFLLHHFAEYIEQELF